MSNLPFLSNLSRPAVMALSGAVALVVIVGLLFAAVPRGDDGSDAASQTKPTRAATGSAVASPPATVATGAATPDVPAAGVATPAVGAMLTNATPSALISGGWGSGPQGDAGAMRSYPGPGPQGDFVDVAWMLSIPPGYEAGLPVVYGNRLLVTATSEAFGSNLTVYELESGNFLWNYAESRGFSSPFVATGRIFLTADDSLTALSLETGEVLWTQRIAPGDDQQNTGDEARTVTLSGSVADGDAVIVAAGDAVIALDAETGVENWRRSFAGSSYFGPWLLGDVVLIYSVEAGGGDGAQGAERYHGISLETGSELWRQDASSPRYVAGSADAGVVVVSDFRTGDLETRMFDARTGSPVRVEAPCDARFPGAAAATVACGPFDVLTGESLPGADGWPDDGVVAATTDDAMYMMSGTQLSAVDVASGDTSWSIDLAQVELSDGTTFLRPGVIGVGDRGVAVEVRLEDAEAGEEARAIWILRAASEPAATPVAGGTPAASPVASGALGTPVSVTMSTPVAPATEGGE